MQFGGARKDGLSTGGDGGEGGASWSGEDADGGGSRGSSDLRNKEKSYKVKKRERHRNRWLTTTTYFASLCTPDVDGDDVVVGDGLREEVLAVRFDDRDRDRRRGGETGGYNNK